MKYYRLIEKAPDRSPLGYGTAGGRWNLDGTPMIYASNFSAINFLELLSIKGPAVARIEWILVTLHIEGDIPQLDATHLLINPLHPDRSTFIKVNNIEDVSFQINDWH